MFTFAMVWCATLKMGTGSFPTQMCLDINYEMWDKGSYCPVHNQGGKVLGKEKGR